jgi:hypothetical protein
MLPPHRNHLLVPLVLGGFDDKLARPVCGFTLTALLSAPLNGAAPVVDTRLGRPKPLGGLFDAVVLGIIQYLFALGR